MPRGTMVRLLFAIPLLAAGIALGTPAPASAATTCNGGINVIAFGATTVKDSLVVPPGGFCIISGSVVRGGIILGVDAVLFAYNGTEIRGSITGQGANVVSVVNSVVRGSVEVTAPFNLASRVELDHSEIRGDVRIVGFPGTVILVTNNTVRGSVVLNDNALYGSGFWVAGNAIDVNLECSGNTPEPVLLGGGPNVVGGVATGQCAGLV